MSLEGRKITCLGGGAMGEALISGLFRQGLVDASSVQVSDVNKERLLYLKNKFGVSITKDNAEAVHSANIIILAVKPYVLPPLLKEIASVVGPEQTFISIAAGISIAQIEACLPKRIPVIRAIPNTPCLIGEGATALSAGQCATEEHIQDALAIFAATGQALQVPEELLDTVTGLSGSGPAYMYTLLEGFIDGAVRLGLPRDTAKVLIAQTMLGAAKMVLETGEHPAKLKDMVTTPGGTTMAGLFALEEGSVKALMMRAVADATQRAKEMADLK